MQPGAHVSGATVWIVEDNPEYGATVQELVDSAEDLVAARVFSSGEDLLEFLNGHFAPDVMLVDIGLPGISGIEVVREVSRIAPDTRQLMLTIHEDNDRIFEAICAGARGYLLKTAQPQDILTAVRQALNGGAPLSPQIARRVLAVFHQKFAPRRDYDLTDREREVLRELIGGKTKKRMGRSLFVSEHTIDTHLRHIYDKLHVHSRSQAVVKALRENLVRLDGDT